MLCYVISYPQSRMNQSGLYECKNKSVIARHLKEIASANLTNSYGTNTGFSSEINCLLFDGMALVRSL